MVRAEEVLKIHKNINLSEYHAAYFSRNHPFAWKEVIRPKWVTWVNVKLGKTLKQS